MENYKRIISAECGDSTLKSRLIPPEWKPDIDQRLVVDYMAANRYYAENNPQLSKEITVLSETNPTDFYTGLVDAWLAHHAFFESELEPLVEHYKDLDEHELTPQDVSVLAILFNKTIEVDSRTLAYSAAIKSNVAFNASRLASKYGITKEAFISEYLRTETFFSYYTKKNLRYIVDIDEGLIPNSEILAKEFHAGDVTIMESRLQQLRVKYEKVPKDKLLQRLTSVVPEPVRAEGVSENDWDEIMAIRRALLFDNLEEYMIANNLEGVSGYILRKIVSTILSDAKLIDTRPLIYDYDNSEILKGLEELMQNRSESFEKKIKPKQQAGLTCSAACATMIENYVLKSPLDDSIEHLYANKSNSKYMEGQHYSLLAAEMNRRGINVSLVHENSELFKQNGLSKGLFDNLMAEYSEGLSQCRSLGVSEKRDLQINPAYMFERLQEGKIIMLAGQIWNSSILHSVLVTGIKNSRDFVIIDPIQGKKEIWTAVELDRFSNTSIGKWLMVIDTEAKSKAENMP